jgi:hypothetical protein
MKRLIWLVLIFILASPAWAARRITVGQLVDLLHSLEQAKKTDAELADELKQIELTEELTRPTMNTLVGSVPGPLSLQQIYVLEGRSADLLPPVSDLPTAQAPDAATQQAIVAKADAYIRGIYDQLPFLTATKATLRFQDNMEAVRAGSGIVGNATSDDTSLSFSNPATFIHYINAAVVNVESEHGIEKPPAQKDKTPWGLNKMIALQEPDPNLDVVFQEAKDAESIKWLRWELVNGRQVAVYSFAVPKAKSQVAVNVCCFPDVKQSGVARFYTATTASVLGGQDATPGGGGGVAGNLQISTTWHNYKATVPYHGEFFIDPETGVVMRMITEDELNPSEVVHNVDTRIDYGPLKFGNKMLVAPVMTIINTVVVPNGDSGAGGYATRRTLFISEYKDYR